MKELYLIDASGYLFRAYFALPPMSNSKGEATHALYGFTRSILRLIKEFQPTHMAAVFDAKGGRESRQKIYQHYKSHRQAAPDDLPKQIEWAMEFCELWGIPILAIPGVEADDAIGTITRAASSQGAHVYICTSDKDLYQLVDNRVSIINTFRDNLVIDAIKVEEILGVKPSQVVDLLALMGDASDNIPGVSGIGMKTASALLHEFGTLEQILANIDKIKGKKRQETLIAEADTARLSQALANLHEVPDCPVDPHYFALQLPDQENLRDFLAKVDFHSILKDLPTPPEAKPLSRKSKLQYHLVDDENALESLIAQLLLFDQICIDIETTSPHPAQATLVGIGLGVKPGEAWYIPMNGQLGFQWILDQLKPLFSNSRGFFGHNVKYDLHVLANLGIENVAVAFDTIVASYLLNSHQRNHSLDALALHHFGVVKTPIKTLIGLGKSQITMDQVPIRQVSDYCCADVDYTIRLKELFEAQLAARNLTPLMNDLELPVLKVLLKMERHGIYIDVPYLQQLNGLFSKEIEERASEIYALAGEEFNLNSPKQLSSILFEKLGIQPTKKTATGYSTDAEVLEQLAQHYPIAEKVISYRSLDKLRSTYLETLPSQVDGCTGRIHTTFVQYTAATGRLASQDPNLQNIPVRSEEGRKIRQAFRPAEKGWLFLSADYSQVELRLLAHLSQDTRLIEAFNRGEDIHAHTASIVFHVPLSQVTDAQRQQAKAVNFGIIYGQQAWGLARELGVDIKEAAHFIDTYFESYPGVREFVETCKEKARKSGKTSTLMGRERLIPEILSKNANQRNAAERLAVNTPLQGSAADLIKLAMIRVDHALSHSKLRGRLLVQIHDELLLETPDTEVTLLTELVREAMEGAMPLSVALPVTIGVGRNWKEC